MSVVAWYRDFTDAEIGSGTVIDKSGQGNDGTLEDHAAITAVSAKGRVLSFPASVSSSVVVADSASLSPTAAVSVGAWVYRLDNTQAMVVNKNESYRLRFPDGTGLASFEVYIGGTWYSATAAVPVPTQQWIFLQGSYDGAHIKLFQQGAERASVAQTGSINDSSAGLLIGAADQYHGYIGEVLVKDAGVTLEDHKDDLRRWLKREAHNLIELLQIKIPGNPINVCTYNEPITVTVYS